VAKDGKSDYLELKKNVVWHDGKRSPRRQSVFNWEYAADPPPPPPPSAPTRTSPGSTARQPHRQAHIQEPDAVLADGFCGYRGMIIPKHMFEPIQGGQVP